MTFELDRLPPQPPEQDWRFVEELRTAPYHQPVEWHRPAPRDGEAFFPGGVHLDPRFDDPQALLETAYADFRYFLGTVSLREDGRYSILVRQAPTDIREAYRVTITRLSCELAANDCEGIRRGLVWIEDEMLRRGGPFLPLGIFERTPVIRTRLSRCFYGPINRPPKSRDELTDDVDYYPEAYLNRLAHEGVNALWLTLHFFQSVPSRIIPEYGVHAAPRLDKLARVVAKCARYGIRIYPFCIEPAAFTWPYPELAAAAEAHPDLRGHAGAFCTSTEKGRAYLEEATRTLFTQVPGLGGLVVIPVGERLTHCHSGYLPRPGHSAPPNTCPRCSQRQPWQVLADTLAAMKRGMSDAAPEAELVAWPYGQFICWGSDRTVEAAGHLPPGVILQHNFETGGWNEQLGKPRPAWDYWLSYAGPSALFRSCAEAAVPRGTRVSAKLQVSCSHEVATAQVVPVPGILYKKYDQMHRLGVSAAMHSWYFGTYPSLMTKAAGELSFAPFPQDVEQFLLSLARRDWGPYAPQVVQAWNCFGEAYAQYPTAHILGYYGPMHDGPVWPLYLVPRRLPLAPTWQIGYAPSGDYIAECITNGFTLEETLVLCQRLADRWADGVQILRPLLQQASPDSDRALDIGIAVALGLQFRSGYNILRFYALRERLADSTHPAERREILGQMRDIVGDELKIDRELLSLALADSRLGFHAEAEGFKYHPALIRWRIDQLHHLLEREFPVVEQQMEQPGPLFPAYTGEAPLGPSYSCTLLSRLASPGIGPLAPSWNGLPFAECAHWLHQVYSVERWRRCPYDRHDHLPLAVADRSGRTTRWQACCDREALTLRVLCTPGSRPTGAEPFAGDEIQVLLEPRRTQPRVLFQVSPDGTTRHVVDDGYLGLVPAGSHGSDRWHASSEVDAGRWAVALRIPFAWLGLEDAPPRTPLRINVVRTTPVPDHEGRALCSWVRQQPVRGRLVWGTLNPAADFGWLSFASDCG